MERPTCPKCGTPAKLRKRTPSKGQPMFAFYCESCGARGTEITPGRYWIPHLQVGAYLGPYGDPLDLVERMPDLP